MWALSSLTRDQTCIPWIARWILNQWTIREVPRADLLKVLVLLSLTCLKPFRGPKLSPRQCPGSCGSQSPAGTGPRDLASFACCHLNFYTTVTLLQFFKDSWLPLALRLFLKFLPMFEMLTISYLSFRFHLKHDFLPESFLFFRSSSSFPNIGFHACVRESQMWKIHHGLFLCFHCLSLEGGTLCLSVIFPVITMWLVLSQCCV